jgi:formylglycine-generating enzyme required for sulfatase activity
MKIVIPIDRWRGRPYYRLRGGSWRYYSGSLRVADRGGIDPSNRGFYIGFRFVKKK